MSLTDNRLRVLQAIRRNRRATAYQLRGEAPYICRSPREWAIPYCRWLKENGLISVAGKDRVGARIYTITDAGRKALEDNA